MKILLIAPDLPFPPNNGGRMRTYALAKNLAERHEVSLLAFNRVPEDLEHLEKLNKICTRVYPVPLISQQLRKNKRKAQLQSILNKSSYQKISHYSQLMQEKIDQVTQTQDFDIIQVEFSQMGYYDLPPSNVTVLDQHNIEADILYRTYLTQNPSVRKLYSYLEWKKFKQDEIAICNKFSACLTTSNLDKETLAKSSPNSNIHVIPNGVDSKFFRSINKARNERNIILFTGTINYFPNTDGLRFFLKQIFPLIQHELPSAQFVIAGKYPPPDIEQYANRSNIVVTGYVEDIREYFEKASLVVVPLRIGGGTRLKILEAMAMEKPIVSTHLGAEGIDVSHGENILLADQPHDFAQEVIELMKNELLQKRLAKNGRHLIETKYDWKIISRHLEQTYEKLLHPQDNERLEGRS